MRGRGDSRTFVEKLVTIFRGCGIRRAEAWDTSHCLSSWQRRDLISQHVVSYATAALPFELFRVVKVPSCRVEFSVAETKRLAGASFVVLIAVAPLLVSVDTLRVHKMKESKID